MMHFTTSTALSALLVVLLTGQLAERFSPSDVKQLALESTQGSSAVSLHLGPPPSLEIYPPQVRNQQLPRHQLQHTCSPASPHGFPTALPSSCRHSARLRRWVLWAMPKVFLQRLGTLLERCFLAKHLVPGKLLGRWLCRPASFAHTAQRVKPKPHTSNALQAKEIFPLKSLIFMGGGEGAVCGWAVIQAKHPPEIPHMGYTEDRKPAQVDREG